MTDKSDTMLLYEFFGLKEGQARIEFIQELKELSDQERVVLAAGIRDESLTY